MPSSLPDEQEDNNGDSDYDDADADADATETCASDESLIESLESIDWTTDSTDNELYYLCWDSDEEILVLLGEDDNRGIASGGGSNSIGGSGGDSIDAGDTPQRR